MSVQNLKDDNISLRSSGAKNVTTPNLNDPNVIKAMDKIKFSMGLSHLGDSSNKSKSPMALVSEPGSLQPFKNSQKTIVVDNDSHGSGAMAAVPSCVVLTYRTTLLIVPRSSCAC